MSQIRRALVSVSDKTGVVEFVKALVELGVEVISTGGTEKLLKAEGVPVAGISEVTGFPEILDGRVKTLHPRVHSGILAIRSNPDHMKALEELGIKPIDLVVVNLYPFKATISKPDVTFPEAIENIDIGGPSMLRAAAKNHQDVTVVVDAADYGQVLAEMKAGGVTIETKRRLAAKVFQHTAAYDALIARYLGEQIGAELPDPLTLTFDKVQDLRYGENPHQKAAFYRLPLGQEAAVAQARQLNGKELSYNNINDADAALAIVKEFEEPAAVAVKHTNPCGVGVGGTILEAYKKAYEADPVSIFGGIVALNREVDKELALMLKEIFLEIVMAPAFTPEALEVLREKKNLRVLALGDWTKAARQAAWTYRTVEGGLLVQEADRGSLEQAELRVVTKRQPSEEEWQQLRFAWRVVKHVKSNAIVLAKDNRTVGVGAGQMNRVGAARIAIEQAGEKSRGAVMASDAFFPMPDTVEEAAKAGVKAIIQPGGSIRDEDSIAEADRHGMAMVFTGMRHFKH